MWWIPISITLPNCSTSVQFYIPSYSHGSSWMTYHHLTLSLSKSKTYLSFPLSPFSSTLDGPAILPFSQICNFSVISSSSLFSLILYPLFLNPPAFLAFLHAVFMLLFEWETSSFIMLVAIFRKMMSSYSLRILLSGHSSSHLSFLAKMPLLKSSSSPHAQITPYSPFTSFLSLTGAELNFFLTSSSLSLPIILLHCCLNLSYTADFYPGILCVWNSHFPVHQLFPL